MSDVFTEIHQQIIDDPMNASMRAKGYDPLYAASADAKIAIVGQAPGRRAQEVMVPWQDARGDVLRKWLGCSNEQFYDPALIALLPMDFYYPGSAAHGDLPPRKGFAEKWHPKLLEQMPNIELIVLVGSYAQKYYLKKHTKQNLTETVRAFNEYLPDYFPLVHPSPLNFRWRAKNPWFDTDVLPVLRCVIDKII
jgi:uracil-DNA glycosylase